MFKRKTVKYTAVLLAIFLLLQTFSAIAALADAKTVKSFSVICDGGKNTYFEGEDFDPEGYVGTVTYTDGTEEVVSGAILQYSVASPLTENTAVVFACPANKGYTASLPVTVISITSIGVSGDYRKDYLAGEDIFNPAGLILTLNYSDNSYVRYSYVQSSGVTVEVATSSSVIPSSADLVLSAETGTVLSAAIVSTVSCTIGSHAIVADIPINVKPISTIEVSKIPEGEIHEGTVLDPAPGEIEIRGYYQGVAEPVILQNYTIDNLSSLITADENGEMVYNVSYEGLTASFRLPVTAISFFDVVSSTGMQELYFHSDSSHSNVFDSSAISISAIYDNGDVIDISSDVIYSAPEYIVSGSIVSSAFAGYEISLEPVLKIHSATMEIVRAPDKTNYKPGESFVPDGFAAKVKYDDGTTVYLDASQVAFVVSDPLAETDGNAKAVWSGGLDCTVDFRVEPERQAALSVDTPPDTIKYVDGQPLDLEGMVVSVTFDEEEPVILSSAQYVTLPAEGEKLTMGMTSFIIRYYLSPTVYYETEQPIEIEAKKATAIFVAEGNGPSKTEYNEGEKFNTAGMKLSVSYNDGSTRVLTGGFTADPNPFILKSTEATQTVSVKISYGSLQCYYDVQVAAKTIDKISIIQQPFNVKYMAGATFSPDGMKVAVYYSDKPTTAVELDSSFYSCYPSGKLTAQDTEITVYFRGLTASCPIEVIGETTSAVTTPEITTQAGTPDDSSVPEVTSASQPNESSAAVTTQRQGVVTSGPERTTAAPQGGGSSGNPIIVLWIVIISLIIVLLVVLIVYYKKHFT